ncbi:hypothetical protein [Actinomadura madurae]|uniref:hypothetical protein n=1 Tax=Actinomadura madurae TaxID=1993 RepID=UPI0020D20AED|nr:hypothetical protein [Actinomadura madurae]MCP9964747.1 hypothetical protein [Actinomadura madurae]MCP9977226.1 hypothetical protein [Actinomadura madurae]
MCRNALSRPCDSDSLGFGITTTYTGVPSSFAVLPMAAWSRARSGPPSAAETSGSTNSGSLASAAPTRSSRW